MLETAGLLERTKDGRVHRIRLVADPMLDAIEWLAGYGRFWEESLDSLEALLREPTGKASK